MQPLNQNRTYQQSTTETLGKVKVKKGPSGEEGNAHLWGKLFRA